MGLHLQVSTISTVSFVIDGIGGNSSLKYGKERPANWHQATKGAGIAR